jgi:glycine/D-amino acid oxidase-like deaminating enzyme
LPRVIFWIAGIGCCTNDQVVRMMVHGSKPAGRKNLRGGRALWSDSPHIRVKHRTVLKKERCDVAVVGAGISGAIIAVMLAEAGQDVVVIDRREPIHGSTLASTAMIQFELDTPLTELADKIGAASAERAYHRSLQAVTALIELVGRHDIQCCLKQRSALYLAGNAMGWRGLRDEASYRARIGLHSEFLDQKTLSERFSIERTGAILSSGAAELNPVQCAAGCLRAAQRFGARIYAPISVEKIDAASDGVELTTATGGRIRARRVIFATGYEVAPGIPKGEYAIISSWAIATKPLKPDAFWPMRCLIWEASDPYLYLRSTIDNRIVAGGEDSGLTDPKRRDHAIAAKSRALLAKIEELLPGRRLAIDYAWAGAFADSPTGLPHIAKVDGMANCLAVLGCGGNGITFSMVAAQLARHWVGGRTDPDADLFR